jgi:phage terminase large subunit-like protein
MVQATITQMGTRNINVQLVNATRGKVVRAEPISALYEQGLVFHSDEYPALEDELCTTRFEDLEKSPNRLDALVWAMTELCENNFDFNVRVI